MISNSQKIPLLIGYIENEKRWQITECLPDRNIDYTPQAFEAEYGFLPRPSTLVKTAYTKKQWAKFYAHRQNKNPTEERGSSRGFG